jgi:uncharacterized membrane protein
MENSYLWLKTIHLLGVILFLGNIIITGWWKNMADLTRNPKVIAFAQRQVTVTDWIFTAGGAAILLGAGMVNVALHGLSYASKWLSWGMSLFVLSGIIWAFILIPTQIKQAKMASVFAETGVITDYYWKLCRRWNIWGGLAVVIPLIAVYFMTFKTLA